MSKPFGIGDMVKNIRLSDIIGVGLFPLALSFLMPMFMTAIALEKQEKLREMMEMMGMSSWIYWLSAYLYDFALYTVIVALFIGAEVGVGVNVIVQTDWRVTFMLFFLWGHAQIATAFLLSTFVDRVRTATVLGYMFVLLASFAGDIFNAQIFLLDRAPLAFFIVPILAFYRGMYLLFAHTTGIIGPQLTSDNLYPLTWEDVTRGNEIQTVFASLGVMTVILLLLTLYLDQVIPRGTSGVAVPWYVPFQRVFCCGRSPCCGRHKKKPSRSVEAQGFVGEEENANIHSRLLPPGPMPINSYGTGGPSRRIPSPVKDMWHSWDANPGGGMTGMGDYRSGEDGGSASSCGEEVAHGGSIAVRQFSPTDIVVVDKLCKVFGKKTADENKALKDVSFSVQVGTCFGLLGQNGAGKTTLFNIVTGMISPSSGTVFVCGFDVRTHIQDVRRLIGLCPQFDCLWGDLSPREHLQFFSRLRGRSRSDAVIEAEELLNATGLQACSTRISSRLSGGMRRRLALAIAMCGNPPLVVADEPTTGLDPQHRRQVWDLLNTIKSNRVLWLTTHSLDEADVLCTDIGILVEGELRALGTPLHLKSRFGSGHKLVLSHELGAGEDTALFVRERFPGASVLSSLAGKQNFLLPTGSIKASQVVEILERDIEEFPFILDWSLSQASLEDVFMNVLDGASKAPSPPPGPA